MWGRCILPVSKCSTSAQCVLSCCILCCQIRYIAEIIVCIDSLTNLVFQLEEVRSQGIKTLIQNQARTEQYQS